MNERIKELYEQSLTRETTKDANGNPLIAIKQNPEKFAEFIADECAKICEDLSFSPEGPSHEAKYQRNLCADEIRKVFGVPAKFRKGA